MELVLPENRLDLLFDDILFVGHARQEHESMCDVFRKIVGRDDAVLQITDLLRHTFELEDARLDFVDDICRLYQDRNLHTFASDLGRLGTDELLDFALTGRSPLPINMQPLPNLIFMRDVAAVVHDHIVLSHAASAVRVRRCRQLRTDDL
jgi:arginine deiminase